MAQQQESGMFVRGEFKGYRFVPWNDDEPQGNGDHVIYIKTGEGKEPWGEAKDYVEEVVVFGEEQVGFYAEKADELRGKFVELAVRIDLKAGTSKRTGKPYAFNTTRQAGRALVRVVKAA